MSVTVTVTEVLAGLMVDVSWPLDEDTSLPRDDFMGLKIWASTVSGFTPDASTLVYDGADLHVTLDALAGGVPYYLRWALVSEIDPTDYTISDQVSATPKIITSANQSTYIQSLTADLVTAGMLRGRAVATKGSYLTSACSAGATTLNLKDTSDFPSSGKAYVVDNSTLDEITYTGKTASTLTGVTGALAHAVNMTVVPAQKCILIDTSSNEVMAFDEWVGGITCVARVGGVGGSMGVFGIDHPSYPGTALSGTTGSGNGVYGLSLNTGRGISGEAFGPGIGVQAKAAEGDGMPLRVYPTTGLPTGSLYEGGHATVGGHPRFYDGSAWNYLLKSTVVNGYTVSNSTFTYTLGSGSTAALNIKAGGAVAASAAVYVDLYGSDDVRVGYLGKVSSGSSEIKLLNALSGGAITLQNQAGNQLSMNGSNGRLTSLPTYNNTTASAANVFVDSSGLLYRSTSTEKLKTGVEPIGLEWARKLFQIDWVYYRSLCEADNPKWGWYGALAEQVAKIDCHFVHYGRPTKRVDVKVADAVQARSAFTDDFGTFHDAIEAREEEWESIEVEDTDAPLHPIGLAYERFVAPLAVIAKNQEERLQVLEAQLAEAMKIINELKGALRG